MPANLNKVSVAIILGLVVLHALYDFAGLVGAIETTFETPQLILILLLDILVIYGLYYTQAWSWWLLLFYSIYGVIQNIATILQGDATSQTFIYFLLNIILLGALTKKETIDEYRPNLTYIKGW